MLLLNKYILTLINTNIQKKPWKQKNPRLKNVKLQKVRLTKVKKM